MFVSNMMSSHCHRKTSARSAETSLCLRVPMHLHSVSFGSKFAEEGIQTEFSHQSSKFSHWSNIGATFEPWLYSFMMAPQSESENGVRNYLCNLELAWGPTTFIFAIENRMQPTGRTHAPLAVWLRSPQNMRFRHHEVPYLLVYKTHFFTQN